MTKPIGIDAISYYVPSLYLSIETLAQHRHLNYEKLYKGLGLEKMSIADSNEDVSSFAANALIDLFKNNDLDPQTIGRIYMGTESALDASKPSAIYATELLERHLEPQFGQRCLKNCDVTDLTFACIGGVDALHNSLDWIAQNPGKKAIVVSSDLSKYKQESTGEYTQGAGAVALLLSEHPALISIDNQWGIASKSEHDFFKPRRHFDKSQVIDEIIATLNLDITQDEFSKLFANSTFWNTRNESIEIFNEEPIFDGQYSNLCYVQRMQEALDHFQNNKKTNFLNEWTHLIFHLPYAFHGRRMIFDTWLNWVKADPLYEHLIDEIGSEEDELFNKKAYKSKMYKDFIKERVSPGEKASSSIGNLYTASIFMSLLSLLNHHFDQENEIAGETIGFISYGSGSKAKIFQGTIQAQWKEKIRSSRLFNFLDRRTEISFEIYQDLHSNKPITPQTNENARLTHLEESPHSQGYRHYRLQN